MTTLTPQIRITQFRVLVSEWVKLRTLRSSYIALGAAFVIVAGMGIVFAAFVASNWATAPPRFRDSFEPTEITLRGAFLGQLIIGVLGVLIVTGEYSTGMIKASLSAAPTRLPVLWAKLIVFAAVTLILTTVAAFLAFLIGQGLLSSQNIGTTLAAPGVLRAVFGAGLYLTVIGLLGMALGWIIRHSAGAIGTLFGLLLILPALVAALPTSVADRVARYLPSTAGQQVMAVRPEEPGLLSPWAGFAVFCAWLAVAVVLAALRLTRRDA